MASSSVEICNSALVKVGADRITALTDDTKAAILCNERYDKLRKVELRSHPWNFAIDRVSLAEDPVAPAYEFDKKFLIPSNVLRILDIQDSDLDRFKIEGKFVLTNRSTVEIKYIKDQTDVSFFDDTFTEMLALRLASDIAYSLTNSNSLTKLLIEAYLQAARDARSFDAQEGSADKFLAEEFLNERF